MKSTTELVNVGSIDDAFTRGGNRLCFIDPKDQARCIKLPRPDKLPALKRQQKSFPKNLKPLRSFDDNYEENKVFSRIESRIGESAFELIPRCYGFVETNLGKGLCLEMIRDDDGAISVSLKQYLWLNGFDQALEAVFVEFEKRWKQLAIPSRNLLLHNVLVQKTNGKPSRLVVIDGLGWPDLVPLGYFCQSLARRKAERKLKYLHGAIKTILQKKKNGSFYGEHGWLNEEQRKG